MYGGIYMATFKRFEDILAWQKARETTSLVYRITSRGMFAKDFGLRDQLRKASVSIMANIAEGFGRRSDKEFSNFLNIAHGSTAECQSHLYVALDAGYIEKPEFDQLYAAYAQCSKMIIGLIHHLRVT
jgi:four helix bundle protein